MASQYNFDKQSAQRIANVVRNAERTAGQGGAGYSARVLPSARFWVKLDDEDPDNAGRYNWTLQQFVSGKFKDDDHDPVIKDDTHFSAHHANSASGLSGDYVELFFYGYDGGGSGGGGSSGGDTVPIYLFNLGGSLPTGQYQYQMYGMVSQNQTGFTYILAHPMGSDPSSNGSSGSGT